MVVDINEKLLAAFQVEHVEHLEGIRSSLAKLRRGTAGGPDLEDAFRRAHSLKGAARVMGFSDVEGVAHHLESLFSQVQASTVSLDQQVFAVIELALNAIEDCVASSGSGNCPTAEVIEAIDGILGTRAAAAPPPVVSRRDIIDPAAIDKPSGATQAPVETLRMNAGNLDRLLQSTGQLLTESLQQEVITRELATIDRRLHGLEHELESVKKASVRALRRTAETPELARLGRYLDGIDREVHSLSRHARAVRLQQQRSSWSLRLLTEKLQDDVRRARMVPAESEFQSFRKMMRDLARDEGKELEFRVSGFDIQADRMVLQALKDPLMHILRNAVTHGIERPEERRRLGKNSTGVVELTIDAIGSRLSIVVEDDGLGVDLAKVAQVAVRQGFLSEEEATLPPAEELERLLFQPGFTTFGAVTELAGRGMGLSTVYETVSRLQGEVHVQPRNGAGTTLRLVVPLSISTHRLLLASCQGQMFAIPIYGVERLHRIKIESLQTVEGRPMLALDGQLLPLTSLPQLLGFGESDVAFKGDHLQLVILRSGSKRVAVAVDALVAERNAFIKDLGRPASRIRQYLGGVLLEDGSVCLVLNPVELIDRFQPLRKALTFKKVAAAEDHPAPTILVVDDSFTTRTLETSILETYGYRVRVAVDGVDALAQIRSEKIDLVITDIQMPRLDGFGLLAEMKKDERLARIPVIVVSSIDRREDQERGLSLGADAYIVKQKFNHQDLLQTIQQIL